MRRLNLTVWIVFISLIAMAAPLVIFYNTDSARVARINDMEKRIVAEDRQKSGEIILGQIQAKLDALVPMFDRLAPAGILKKYAPLRYDPALRNANYTRPHDLKMVKNAFAREAKRVGGEMALVGINGRAIAATSQALAGLDLKSDAKFIQAATAAPNTAVIQDLNYAGGRAVFYMPVLDAKGKAVSVIYAAEDLSDIITAVRSGVMPKQGSHGAVFVTDDAGRAVMHSDESRVNSDAAGTNGQMKFLTQRDAEYTRVFDDFTYDGAQGFFGYAKNTAAKVTVCVFAAAADYPEFSRPESVLKPALYSPSVMGVLGAVILLLVLFAAFVSSGPYRPVAQTTRALAHVDEEVFEELLPRERKGDFRKLIDSIRILRGRARSAEEKAEKLSMMSKELEEELSNEASRADKEISELQAALKKTGASTGVREGTGLTTVKDILSSGAQAPQGEKPNLPGKDFTIPPGLRPKLEPAEQKKPQGKPQAKQQAKPSDGK